jgi:predicted amidohydrolase
MACNAMLVVAANRIGNEDWDELTMSFFGSSFITDPRGEIVAQASREVEEVVAASLDCKSLREERAAWCFFRVRRPYTIPCCPISWLRPRSKRRRASPRSSRG